MYSLSVSRISALPPPQTEILSSPYDILLSTTSTSYYYFGREKDTKIIFEMSGDNSVVLHRVQNNGILHATVYAVQVMNNSQGNRILSLHRHSTMVANIPSS
jgi:hypothetical protein